MCTPLRHTLTDLPRGTLLRIDEGDGRVVAVFDGEVWLTQDNDPNDFFVGPGESFALASPGLVVVQALSDARLMVYDTKPLVDWSSAHELYRAARAARDATIAAALVRGAVAAKAMFVRAARRWAARWQAIVPGTARPVMPARG